MKDHITLNADLGEGSGKDDLLMPLIDACNIACGGHYGDTSTMLQALLLARQYGVRVGAHPSFPDRAHFGREPMRLSSAELQDTLGEQIEKLYKLCQNEGVELHHVKLHGALYNMCNTDETLAGQIIEILVEIPSKPRVFAPERSVLAQLAKGILEVVPEAFADRRYDSSTRLVPREHPHAIIENPVEAWAQIRQIIEENTVTTIGGKQIPLRARTFCIHSDSPNAIKMAGFLNAQIKGMTDE